MNTLYKMKQDSKADAILVEIAKIAENSVKKYLDNAGRIAVVAENSVKNYLGNTVAENAVAENSINKYLDNTVAENAVAENSVNKYLDNTVAENAVTDNGLIFSRIKKTAEDCLRNYLENNLESGIDITSMKKQLPIIDTKQKTKTVNQTILEPMNDILNKPITKTNSNDIVNEGVSKTNSNDNIVNESKTSNDNIVNESKTNNDNIVNEGVSKTNNDNIVNESSEYIDNYDIESNYDTTTDSAKIIKNTPILIEIARIAEESVKSEMIKSIPQMPKKEIRDDDTKQGIRELFVSPDTNSIVRNNDNGKYITNKKIIDSNTSLLPPLPTPVPDLSSVIDKSRVDDMMNEISKTAINAVMNVMGIKNNVDYTTRNDNTQDEETRQHMLNAQPGQKRGEKPIQDVSIEIEEPIQDVSIETDEDAYITIKDLSYSNDEKNDTTETTYLKVDPKDTGKFIITRKRQ